MSVRHPNCDGIHWEIAERAATVWLPRPHRHNAWAGTMHTECRQVLAALEHRDDVRVVVVTGTPAFCVGSDSTALAWRGARRWYDSALAADPARPGGGDRIDADIAWQLGYRLPIIAAVNGACAGIGLSLLVLFCDLRFVAADAKLTTPAPKLDLPAECASSWMLPRLIGVIGANDLLLAVGSRVVTGAETAEWGLWNGMAQRRSSPPSAAARCSPRARGRTPSP